MFTTGSLAKVLRTSKREEEKKEEEEEEEEEEEKKNNWLYSRFFLAIKKCTNVLLAVDTFTLEVMLWPTVTIIL